MESARETADEGNLPTEQQAHGYSSRIKNEAAGDGIGGTRDTEATDGGGSNGAPTVSTSPANPAGHGEVKVAGAPAAARWGAGLSEQVQTVLNHGRAKIHGVVTRYSHLQHVQVRGSLAAEGSGGERRDQRAMIARVASAARCVRLACDGAAKRLTPQTHGLGCVSCISRGV